MRSATDDELRKNFGRIWPAHVANLTEFLISARLTFDGDLDLLLVLAVIGDRSFASDRVAPSMTFDEFMSDGWNQAQTDLAQRVLHRPVQPDSTGDSETQGSGSD